MKRNYVLAMTGASGVAYAVRLLEVLSATGCDVYLSISAAARSVLKHELDLAVDLDDFAPSMLMLSIALYCRWRPTPAYRAALLAGWQPDPMRRLVIFRASRRSKTGSLAPGRRGL